MVQQTPISATMPWTPPVQVWDRGRPASAAAQREGQLGWPDLAARVWFAARGSAMKAIGVAHLALFRASAGRIGRTFRGGAVLLLTTTGRRTGEARTWPLVYQRTGDDIVVVASAAGAPRHPSWYHNLRANPEVRVQVGERTVTMLARTAKGADRSQLWERFVQQFPSLARYQELATREIPVVVLKPVVA